MDKDQGDLCVIDDSVIDKIYAEEEFLSDKKAVRSQVKDVNLTSNSDFKSLEVTDTKLGGVGRPSQIIQESFTQGDITATGEIKDSSISFDGHIYAPTTNNILLLEEVVEVAKVEVAPIPQGMVFIGTADAQAFVGGAGIDTVDYSGSLTSRVSVSFKHDGHVGDSAGDTFVGIEILIGTNFHFDTLEGDAFDNEIYGLDGHDNLRGGRGDDKLFGGNGNDNLRAHDGDDSLHGGAGRDELWGYDGADEFHAILDDFLSGTIDTAKDFDLSEGDTLNLTEVLFQFDQFADDITNFVQITDDGTDSFVGVDVDGTASFNHIMTLEGVTGLSDEAALIASGDIVI